MRRRPFVSLDLNVCKQVASCLLWEPDLRTTMLRQTFSLAAIPAKTVLRLTFSLGISLTKTVLQQPLPLRATFPRKVPRQTLSYVPTSTGTVRRQTLACVLTSMETVQAGVVGAEFNPQEFSDELYQFSSIVCFQLVAGECRRVFVDPFCRKRLPAC